MTYAIIGIGGKQYRVREGEWLLVDRVAVEAGKTFKPDVLLLGGDGDARFGADLKGEQVTALVSEHVLGEKVVVGKHRQRTGYRRRKGHRSRLSRIEIQSIGAKTARKAAANKDADATAEKPGARKSTTKSETTKSRSTRAKKTEGKSE